MPDIPAYDDRFVFPKKEDFKRFKDGIFDDSGWKEKLSKGQMKVFTKTLNNSNIRACKVRTIYTDIDGETLFGVLHDHEYRKLWDINMINEYVIEKVDKRTEIEYFATKMPSLISNRDFCSLKTWESRPKKGEWVIFNYSINHPKCPEKKGFIRANSILNGFYIRKLDIGTEFNYYSQSDPRGWIPTSIINKLTVKLSARLVEQIYAVSKDYKKWKEKSGSKDK